MSKAKYIRKVFINKGPTACVKLNGSYVFLLHDKRRGSIYIGTDQNSFIPTYYTEQDNIVYFSWDINTIYYSLENKPNFDYQNIFAWILTGGMGFINKTRFEGVNKLEPGSFISVDTKGLKETTTEPFYYYPKDISYDSLLNTTLESLYTAVKRRVVNHDRIGIGLSGGIDSRIVLAATEKQFSGNLLSYTYGKTNFNEIDIAKRVSDYYSIAHTTIEIPDLIYIEFSHDGVYYAGGNSLFKHGIQFHLFRSLKKMLKTQGILLGSALDCTAGCAWMTDSIYDISNKEDLFKYYIDHHVMKFSRSGFKDLFLNSAKGKELYSSTIDILESCLNNIHGDSIPDINTSFFLELRGKRWYNHNLIYQMFNHRLLTPTYDTDFLQSLAAIPYRYRRDDRFRIDLLKALDRRVAEIPYDSTMQPASLPSPYTHKFRAKLDEIEKEQLRVWIDSGGEIYLPSNRFDANFLEWIRVYPEYQKFYSDLLTNKESILCDQFLKREKIRQLINEHISGKKSHHKLLGMLASTEIMMRTYLYGKSNTINRNFIDFSKYFKN